MLVWRIRCCTDCWQCIETCDCYPAYFHWWQEQLLLSRFQWPSLSTYRTALGCLPLNTEFCLQACRSPVSVLSVDFLVHLHNVMFNKQSIILLIYTCRKCYRKLCAHDTIAFWSIKTTQLRYVLLTQQFTNCEVINVNARRLFVAERYRNRSLVNLVNSVNLATPIGHALRVNYI